MNFEIRKSDPALRFTQALQKRRQTVRIILHHYHHEKATPHDVHHWHRIRGWKGIGYNVMVEMDGSIWEGRGLDKVGTHTANNNNNSIGIACQGRYDDRTRKMPDAQFNSLIWLIKHIHSIYGEIPIFGHGEVSPSACPGRFFPLDEVRQLAFRGNLTASFPISEANLQAMIDLGVINSPDYWRTVNVQWLDQLLTNAAQPNRLNRLIQNGINDIHTALNVLEIAGIMSNPDYWYRQHSKVEHLGQLIINMANRSLSPQHRIVHADIS